MLPSQTSTEDPPKSRGATGNQTPRHHFLHPDIISRVVCHLSQLRIHSIVENGKEPPVLLSPTGGAPIDPAVFGYIRVSQAEGESGLATQRRTLNDHGLRDDRIFTDVASGKNMHRPSWQDLLGMLKPGDTVVVPRLDRLARNLREQQHRRPPARQRTLWENVQQAKLRGLSLRATARELGIHRDTVRKYALAESPPLRKINGAARTPQPETGTPA